MFLMVVVVATALVGGLVPARSSALVSGLLLNCFFTPPLVHVHHRRAGERVAIVLFVVVGIAVASRRRPRRRRTAQASRARAEAMR